MVTGVSGYSYNWDVPDIEATECMLKITGTSSNGTPVNRLSPKFSIGKEYCEILAPLPGERICAEQDYDIKWKSDFVTSFYIQYSTDGGNQWRNVRFSPIDGFAGVHKWKVSNKFTENVFQNANYNFVGKRKLFYLISGTIFAAGIISIALRGLNYSCRKLKPIYY